MAKPSLSDTLPPGAERKPRDDEIDLYGVTHTGKVRKDNQDHYLIASLARQVRVHSTSLPESAFSGNEPARMAFFGMVADGVGGGPSGEEASRVTLENITRYVSRAIKVYYASDPTDGTFAKALEEAATRCHEEIREIAAKDPERKGMATTLSVWIGVWPFNYLLHVGDSRAYLMRDGELRQMSRDQTMAQELRDQGLLTASQAIRTPLANVLSSSIGGSQHAPVVTRDQTMWGDIAMMCSDGLTKHVSDARIKERMLGMTSCKQLCEALLQDALDGGGTDNITIIAVRTEKK